MNAVATAQPPVSKAFVRALIALILVLFAVRNLPWHLDDLDQAKQAFVSYEMIQDGKWLVQDTPRDEIATKPPLQGWISAGIYLAAGGHGWEFAWRIPPFIAAILILRQLWRTGDSLYGDVLGSILAAGTFALNSYVPRLATLVRTDMMLTAFIFFTGWLILEKLRKNEPWTTGERIAVCLLLLGSTLTKGPIAYAFLLPGILAYRWFTRKTDLPRHAFCGWFWWVLPLVVFGVWLGVGLQIPAFKEQVIDHEFLGRFTVGASAQHHNLAPGAYTLSILGRTLPWTLLAVVVFIFRPVREAVKRDPALLWLVCWTLGGLVFMEFVPSKRFDRILPVIPAFALLLARAARYLPERAVFRWSDTVLIEVVTLVGMLGASGYTAAAVIKSTRTDARVLVRLGDIVKKECESHPEKLAISFVRDEALTMYCGVHHYTRFDEALWLWNNDRIQWLILGDGDFRKHKTELGRFDVVSTTPVTPEKADSYWFLRKPGAAQMPGVNPSSPPPPASKPTRNRGNDRAQSAPEWEPPTKLH